MKLYIKREKSGIDATAEYNIDKKEFVVLKGSRVSPNISNSPRFRGAESILKARKEANVRDNVLTQNVVFKSPSTAGNFVTGSSTNGLITWKDENGVRLKELLSQGSED